MRCLRFPGFYGALTAAALVVCLRNKRHPWRQHKRGTHRLCRRSTRCHCSRSCPCPSQTGCKRPTVRQAPPLVERSTTKLPLKPLPVYFQLTSMRPRVRDGTARNWVMEPACALSGATAGSSFCKICPGLTTSALTAPGANTKNIAASKAGKTVFIFTRFLPGAVAICAIIARLCQNATSGGKFVALVRQAPTRERRRPCWQGCRAPRFTPPAQTVPGRSASKLARRPCSSPGPAPVHRTPPSRPPPPRPCGPGCRRGAEW